MRDEHIINLIEDAPLSSLSESDLAAIRVHSDHCSDCRSAFHAAQVSAVLLKERAAAEFEPSPFFHTRVMATWRERQAANSWSWSRLWRAGGALASSMVATVAALAVLTFAVPGTQVAGTQVAYPGSYSAEEILLGQTSQVEEESDGQLLRAIYAEEEETAR